MDYKPELLSETDSNDKRKIRQGDGQILGTWEKREKPRRKGVPVPQKGRSGKNTGRPVDGKSRLGSPSTYPIAVRTAS